MFSHVVKLKTEKWAKDGHAPSEPVLFAKAIGDEYMTGDSGLHVGIAGTGDSPQTA